MMINARNTDRTIFLIPEAHMPRLEREVAKLAKKAQKWHDWTFDVLVIGFQFRDERNGTKTKLLEVCLDVEPIKLDGWEFVARIDHSNDTGNVVRCVPNVGVVVENRFRTAAPNCEHCNHKRLRRDTFVLYNRDTNEFKQVGSTCLADFLGHDAANLGRIAEFAGYATELARALEREPVEQTGLIERRYIDLHNYLTNVAAMVRLNGWVSGKSAYENGYTSTREQAWNNMFPTWDVEPRMVKPTEADIALADSALEWAQAFSEKADLNEYEHNVLVIANSVVIEGRSCGIAASIVGVYWTKFTPKREATKLGDMSAMLSLFKQAGSRLKFPKINLSMPDTGTVVLSVAGDRAKHPGTINVASEGGYGNNEWYGRINLDGTYAPTRGAPKGMEDFLVAFAADPAGKAAKHGHATGQCCFCSRPLTDKRSTEVGYGKKCAENYNLPWNTKSVVVA